jgi:predicted dehydrogenase
MSLVNSRIVNIGIVGCGMVSESIHLPVLTKCKNVRVTTVVDTNKNQAFSLGERYNIKHRQTNYKEIIDLVDAAIVAVPHHLHAPITIDLLQKGLHVFVEKPMALTHSDCREMVELSRKQSLILSVGHVRRLYKPLRKVKAIIDSKKMGNVVRFEMSEGRIFTWPVKTFDTFDPRRGGGVLTDIGSHVIDLALWWFGNVYEFRYYDDSLGGVEANCDIYMKMDNGADGSIHLSRTRDLKNVYRIFFEKGTIEVTLGHDAILKIQRNDKLYREYLDYSKKTRMNVLDYFKLQMENFINTIRGNSDNRISGEEGMSVVKFIERCKNERIQMKYPWEIAGR